MVGCPTMAVNLHIYAIAHYLGAWPLRPGAQGDPTEVGGLSRPPYGELPKAPLRRWWAGCPARRRKRLVYIATLNGAGARKQYLVYLRGGGLSRRRPLTVL